MENLKFDDVNGNISEFRYEELNILSTNNYNNEMKKKKNKAIDKEYIDKYSIRFLAECGFDIEKSDGKLLKLEDYSLNNEEFNDISDNEIIEKKYGMKNNGKYNMNVVRSDVMGHDDVKIKSKNEDITVKDLHKNK
ncbi:hypothetical protein H8356DRAFT_1333385 [Neocallimastix lanati (nom. inval.)]|nr:hypothetical protein H8356DRAFT_1333385 [Neocallimastix sp. JGI-2020a]